MRVEPKFPVNMSNFLQFPTGYKFERSIHGIDTLAGMGWQKVHPLSDTTKCMYGQGANGGAVSMQTCGSSDYYIFKYFPESRQIKNRNYCLTFDDGYDYLRTVNCVDNAPNQQWYYNFVTQEVKSFWRLDCMDIYNDGKLYMNFNCNGGLSQKFVMPSAWLPDISYVNRIFLLGKSLCMTAGSDSIIRMYSCLHSATGTSNQEFYYDALTRQIKYGGKCVDYHYGASYIYLFNCHGGQNQQFFYDTSTNRLKTGWDDKCLNWDSPTDRITVTTCDDRTTEKFALPRHWLEPMSTSLFDEVRLFSNLKLCLTLEVPTNATTGSVGLKECSSGNANQKIFYNSESLEIKHLNTGFCVDYNFGSATRDVWLYKCHGGYNQKWYHERSTNRLRTIHSNMCLDWGNNKLYMHDCHNGDNQKFLVPSLWSGQSSRVIRIFQDFSKCLVYNPDQGNNVYMSKCEESLGKDFEYDSYTGEIKQDGLCLDIIQSVSEWVGKFSNSLMYYGFQPAAGNVLMWPCNRGTSQTWSLDLVTNQIKSKPSSTTCLEMENNGNIIGATCRLETDEKIRVQKFLFPQSWTRSKQDIPKTVYPYYSQHIPPSLWSQDACHVDWLKNVIETCDRSMELLLGSSTSLGTLRATARLVKEKGPDYMPGTCCLDTPLTSVFFGNHVSGVYLAWT